VLKAEDRAPFEQIVLPHLDAACNLAVWILSSRTDAEDVTQDAMLHAFRFFQGFDGGDVRAWLLQIVRNTCYTWLKKHRGMKTPDQFDEEMHMQSSARPESIAIAADDHERLRQALQTIPPRFREVIVLRELQGCSYQEIAAITSIAIGTVMSWLSRARRQLHCALAKSAEGAHTHEL
jgi:RNA polymerase sigma-70 factor, ECF subfamily